MTEDLIAYLKLRIITAALNEGWEPQFTKDERRWFFRYILIDKEKYDELSNKDNGCCIFRSGHNANAYVCLSFENANFTFSEFLSNRGARLSFRTQELAEYAGRQFIQEIADFVFKPRS